MAGERRRGVYTRGNIYWIGYALNAETSFHAPSRLTQKLLASAKRFASSCAHRPATLYVNKVASSTRCMFRHSRINGDLISVRLIASRRVRNLLVERLANRISHGGTAANWEPPAVDPMASAVATITPDGASTARGPCDHDDREYPAAASALRR